jgi:two-component system chemotaxis sensor kinase CheA
LTHLVRNAVDHGIELPAIRQQQGKSPTGHISLRAYHEAGQVRIQIADDGQGLDPARIAATAIRKGLITEDQAQAMSDKDKLRLILMPGFSTVETVTDVSGRGVGMDVVKTNLDTLGGQIGIESVPGQGTDFSIKLPLTLAIIPSQIIYVGGERYAIPQVNMEELVRIPAHQVRQRVERVGDAEVVRLRGDLLPLINLADVIGVQRTYIDPADKTAKPDRRQQTTDLRCDTEAVPADASCHVASTTGAAQPVAHHAPVERRYHSASALNIVVVSAGAIRYGMTVDQLHDSEEIVVKPLGRHLKHCQGYAGATIMGDGRVALILDVTNIARMAGLSGLEVQHGLTAMDGEGQADIQQDAFTLLIFKFAADEQFAVPLRQVERIEKIKLADIETIGDRQVLQYRGQSLPLLALDQVAKVKPLDAKEDVLVIVFVVQGHKVGILAEGPIDTLETAAEFDSQTLKQTGIAGSAIIDGVTTQLINVREMVKIMWPGWFTQGTNADPSRNADKTILFAEDSSFFRAQVKAFIEDEGYQVIDAEDGLSAWNLLNQHGDDIHLVLTDIDMPHLDGFSLSAKIRNDHRYAELPIVALTTLSSEKDVARGYAVGINDYQTKLDPDQLIQSIQKYI